MILIRHGESHFNVHYGATGEDPGIVDAALTEEGARQVRAAARGIDRHDLRRIVASPYTRTLETAAILAEALDLAITVEPLVRERAYFTCDIGTPRSELAARWPTVDFSGLTERWWNETEETEAALNRRCRQFHADAATLEDWRHLLVVSHWGFILGLTGAALQNAQSLRFDPTAA